mgnify:CR=1 FL=1
MSFNDLLSSSLSGFLIEEEVTGCFTVLILHFDSVVLNERFHESIVSFFTESVWDNSLVTLSGSMLRLPSGKVVDLIDLDILLIIRIRVRINVKIVTSLNLSPVIVEMARKG